MTTETKIKKKTVYGLRLRLSDNDPWSDTSWYKTAARRNHVAAMNRIIGGIRTHSFQEKKTLEEIEELWFE